MEILIEPRDLTAFAPSQAVRFAKFTADWNKLPSRVPDVNLDVVDAMGEWTPVAGQLDEMVDDLVKTSLRKEFSDITFTMLRKYIVDGEEVIDTVVTVKNGGVFYRNTEEEDNAYSLHDRDIDDSHIFTWNFGDEPESDFEPGWGEEWDD